MHYSDWRVEDPPQIQYCGMSLVVSWFGQGLNSLQAPSPHRLLNIRFLHGNIWTTNLFFCLIFRTVISYFHLWFTGQQTRLRLFTKVLVLHAEKGLVRAGAPDLTLFHQVGSWAASHATKTKIDRSSIIRSTTNFQSWSLCFWSHMNLVEFPIYIRSHSTPSCANSQCASFQPWCIIAQTFIPCVVHSTSVQCTCYKYYL